MRKLRKLRKRNYKFLAAMAVIAAIGLPSEIFAQFDVPEISNAVIHPGDALPLFGKDQPLSNQARAGIRRAKEWINEIQTPFRDHSNVVYRYLGGQVTVVCAPLELCLIELQAGERLVKNGIHLGDTARWMVTPTVGADNTTQVVIKPVDVGLSSSLALITDRRTYHLRLVSRRDDYMPVVSFHYPEQQVTQWQNYYDTQSGQITDKIIPQTQENIADLDFGYDISRCSSCPWRPLRVYNNGAQTVIQMGNDMTKTEAPALLVMTNQGEQLVNYRVRDGRYIVDQVFEKAVLVVGVGGDQERVTIEHIQADD